MSDDDFESTELDAREQRLFAALPRESPLDAGVEDQIVTALRSQGFLQRRRQWATLPLAIAAALALMIAGGFIGSVIGVRQAQRSSLEAQLVRENLTIAERVLLLQRAGSAYVRAAHAYSDATAKADSTAVEVARQVLLGAAHAVVRSELDAGVASGLTRVLQERLGNAPEQKPNAKPLIWY